MSAAKPRFLQADHWVRQRDLQRILRGQEPSRNRGGAGRAWEDLKKREFSHRIGADSSITRGYITVNLWLIYG